LDTDISICKIEAIFDEDMGWLSNDQIPKEFLKSKKSVLNEQGNKLEYKN